MVFSHNDKRESETLYSELLDKTHRFLGSNHYVRAKVITDYLWFFRHSIDEKTLYALDEEYHKALPHLPDHIEELEKLHGCVPESRNERVWAGYWLLAKLLRYVDKIIELCNTAIRVLEKGEFEMEVSEQDRLEILTHSVNI